MGRILNNQKGYADFIILYLFVLAVYASLVIMLEIPMAVKDKYALLITTREVTRYAATNPNSEAQAKDLAQNMLSNAGLPMTAKGVTLFDKASDVSVNSYDGAYVTSTITYDHPWLISNIAKLFGGDDPQPVTTPVTTKISFRREW